MGDIPGVGDGAISKGIKNSISNAAMKLVRNNRAIANVIVDLVSKVGGEAVEEYIEAILEPSLKNLVLGEKNDIHLLSEDALYSALLGGLTSLVYNAPSTTRDVIVGKNNYGTLENPIEVTGEYIPDTQTEYESANVTSDVPALYAAAQSAADATTPATLEDAAARVAGLPATKRKN